MCQFERRIDASAAVGSNSALVSNLTFEALSEANQTLGPLGEPDDEGSRYSDRYAAEDKCTSVSSSEVESQSKSVETVNTIANEQVLRYQYMQLSMTTVEKQAYYRNRRPSFAYDKPAGEPKSYLMVPKRRYFRKDEMTGAVVGTGTMNKVRKAKREARKAVGAQAASLMHWRRGRGAW